MNWEVIGAVSELIGALAVIASLVYLAYQVRQHTRVIQSSSFQATTDSLNHINMTIASEVNCRDRWRQEKPVRHGRRLRAAAAIALFASGFAAGAALNDALDAAKTAPHIYRTVLENERLRVCSFSLAR